MTPVKTTRDPAGTAGIGAWSALGPERRLMSTVVKATPEPARGVLTSIGAGTGVSAGGTSVGAGVGASVAVGAGASVGAVSTGAGSVGAGSVSGWSGTN